MCAMGSRRDSEWVLNYRSAHCRQVSGNLKSARDHKEVVAKYIQRERGEGRLVGQFQRDKMHGVHVSPLEVIAKSEPGKWRLILDLLSPEGGSVNEGITKELCSLSYMSVDEVASRIVQLGKGALMAKFDLKAAYRNVSVHPDDRYGMGGLIVC